MLWKKKAAKLNAQTVLVGNNKQAVKRTNRKAKNKKPKFVLHYNGRAIRLDRRRTYKIGRATENDICIVHPQISRYHGSIKWDGITQNFVYLDAESRNGSKINGTAVWGPHFLKDNDMIELAAGHTIRFEELKNAAWAKSDLMGNTPTALIEDEFSNLMRSVTNQNVKSKLAAYHQLILAKKQELSQQAFHDQLTGLFNRRYFEDCFPRALRLSGRNNKPLSLIIGDIDFFKNVNDNYGHQKGDEVLEGVAGFIRAIIRQTDIPCRYGGEEMAIILPDSNLKQALKVAEKIRQKVASLSKPQFGVKVTISLGVSSTSVGMRSAASLIKRADSALYFAKESGRNCCKTEQMHRQKN